MRVDDTQLALRKGKTQWALWRPGTFASSEQWRETDYSSTVAILRHQYWNSHLLAYPPPLDHVEFDKCRDWSQFSPDLKTMALRNHRQYFVEAASESKALCAPLASNIPPSKDLLYTKKIDEE